MNMYLTNQRGFRNARSPRRSLKGKSIRRWLRIFFRTWNLGKFIELMRISI